MTESPDKNERLHYLDWLRVLAFWLLILFHSWQPFNHFHWLIKGSHQTQFADVLTVFTHGWRLHLIFLVSGVGTWFAVKSHKTEFFKDRFKRLIIPFLFAVVFICPPQRFFQLLQDSNQYDSFINFLVEYPSYIFSNEFNTSLLLWFKEVGIHVWYLPYLLVMTAVSFPFLIYANNRKTTIQNFISNKLNHPFRLFYFALPIFICRLLLKPLFPAYTDWADFLTYLWPFLYGYILVSSHNSIITILNTNEKKLISIGALSSLILIIGSLNDDLVNTYLNPEYNLYHVLISLLSALIAFCWPLYFVSLFSRKLNRKSKLLPTANESILPIYVVHQTFIVWFGYYIVQLNVNSFAQFLLIFILTCISCILAFLVIKRTTLTRLVFGLKLKN